MFDFIARRHLVVKDLEELSGLVTNSRLDFIPHAILRSRKREVHPKCTSPLTILFLAGTMAPRSFCRVDDYDTSRT